MATLRVDVDQMEWGSATQFYGPTAVYQGHDIVQLKVLSDRRGKGGGIAWLVRYTPPPGKLIKIVATALSDEHVFNLEGGRVTKSGMPVRAADGYKLNPEGQPHSALIGAETIKLIIYRGEPDEIHSLEVVDAARRSAFVAVMAAPRSACLPRRRPKRGVIRSIIHLQAAINRFLRETNDTPKPFTWTAKIITAERHGHQVLDSIQ